MVLVETFLKIIDNSGGGYALCMRVLTNSKLGRPGDGLVVAIKSIVLNKKVTWRKKQKVLKGTVRRAVLLRVTYFIKRWGNVHIKMYTNAIALVGKWDMPVASRIHGPVFFEVRTTKYIKIAALSEGSY